MLLALTAITVMTQSSGTGLSSIATPKVVEAASWLPADTETLIVQQEPSTTLEDSEKPLAESIRTIAEVGYPGGSGEAPQMSYDYIVQGAKDFTLPMGLGVLPYAGCNIVGMQPSELTRLRKKFSSSAKRKTILLGHQVYVFEEKWEQDLWQLYVCFDASHMFVAANKAFLNEVLKRKARPGDKRALPDSLEQWKYIAAGAPFFSVRHFTPKSNNLSAGANMEDPQLVGYSIWLAPDKTRCTVIGISNNPKGYELASQIWKQEKSDGSPMATLTKLDKRTTKIECDAQHEESVQMLFYLFGATGHVIFL